MKIVTFNIRTDHDQDGANSFRFRKDFILEKINAEMPDLICFQEVLPHVAVWLKETLQDYYVVGCGRNADLRNEQLSIAYRKSTMNLMDMETFWLSDEPYVPASRFKKQGYHSRVITEGVFEYSENQFAEEKGKGFLFRVFNIHLDHEELEAREEGLALLLKKAKESKAFPGIPVILTGDFNAEPDSPEMQVLIQNEEFQDFTKDIGITFHGYFAPGGEGMVS